ncbi:MAG: hypothetical protein ACQESR_15340 [Planctomycetota bacterium]
MPCWTHPPRWDIDRDTTIRIRYRIGSGTPVALYLRAFEVPGDSTRRVCVAASPAARPAEAEVVTDHVLMDDEQWHELEFDARLIRERYPGCHTDRGPALPRHAARGCEGGALVRA